MLIGLFTFIITSQVFLNINKIISNYDINIKGQYLKTIENIGYVITDIDREYDKSVVKELKILNTQLN